MDNIDDDINESDLNMIIKKLYETNFFKNINLILINNVLKIRYRRESTNSKFSI